MLVTEPLPTRMYDGLTSVRHFGMYTCEILMNMLNILVNKEIITFKWLKYSVLVDKQFLYCSPEKKNYDIITSFYKWLAIQSGTEMQFAI